MSACPSPEVFIIFILCLCLSPPITHTHIHSFAVKAYSFSHEYWYYNSRSSNNFSKKSTSRNTYTNISQSSPFTIKIQIFPSVCMCNIKLPSLFWFPSKGGGTCNAIIPSINCSMLCYTKTYDPRVGMGNGA